MVTAARAAHPGVGEFSLVTDEREAAPAVEKSAQGAKDQSVYFAESHFAPEGAGLEICRPYTDELAAGDDDNLDLVGV